MVGSRFLRAIKEGGPRRAARGFCAALAAAIALPAGAALAADPNIPDPSTVGTPIVLFSPTPSAAPARPVRGAAAAPAKRSAPPAGRPAAVATAPVTAAPLIPPAVLPARLGPPPAPRPELPMDTTLQPLATPADVTAPDSGGAAPGKPPAS
jgi:hypothetical protein